jgi:AmmeMemoRadiSam system protein A
MTQQTELSEIQGKTLLTLARQTIAKEIGQPSSLEDEQNIKKELKAQPFQEQRGTFVTLNRHGQLRGCIGSIAPVESIASGIRRNAANAAFEDHRFSPLKKEEFSDVEIEVSILTDPQPLNYSDADDLLKKLRPGIDGVILRSGPAGATFLPQVWDQLPKTEDFLGRLCLKAGMAADSWRTMHPEIRTYQVQHFSE